MKDFLLVLFYQAIVAVNTAVILNGIIWLAKRKEKREKQEGEMKTLTIDLPPIVAEGKSGKKEKDSCKNCDLAKFCGSARREPEEAEWAAAKCDAYVPVPLDDRTVKAISPTPPTTGSCAIKPKDGVSTDEAAKLFSKLSQAAAGLGGNSKLDELEETLKYLADTLDRTDKKPVTPERLKEMGFETEKVECRNCKHFLTTDEEYITGTCGQNDEITFANSVRACFEPKEKKAKPSCTDCRWFVKWRDGDTTCANTGLHISANLKGAHCAMFEPKPKDVLDAVETAEKDWSKSKSCEKCRFSTENNEPNPNTVTCRFKQYHPVLRPRDGACWTCENYEPKPSTSKVKPVPSGTKNTH